MENGNYKFDVVVFLNTSGSDTTNGNTHLLNNSEKTSFKGYIENGGGFIGIHAATDTYKDTVWPFYNKLVGGIVQTSPNHSNNNTDAIMDVLKTSHPTVDHIGATWRKSEEYYYWERNGCQLSTDNTVLLQVRSTGSRSFDVPRPITWYKTSLSYDDDNTPNKVVSGFKSFYTARVTMREITSPILISEP